VLQKEIRRMKEWWPEFYGVKQEYPLRALSSCTSTKPLIPKIPFNPIPSQFSFFKRSSPHRSSHSGSIG